MYSGDCDIKGEEFRVVDWSFDGFQVQGVPLTMDVPVNQFVDINFAVHYGAFDVNFNGKARLIWVSQTAAGFEWIHLPSHVRSMFKEYIKTRKKISPATEPPAHFENPFFTPTSIEPLHEPKVEEKLKQQRRVRIGVYTVTAIALTALLALLNYENQFVYSVRAIYPGTLIVINSAVKGVIADVVVKEVDHVNKGDVVATIDSSDLDLQLTAVQRLVKQRKMAVAVGEKAVEDTKEPKFMYASVAESQSAAAKANVAQAFASFKAKENDFNRMFELDKRGLIGKSDLDRTRAEMDSAGAHLQAVKEGERLADKMLEKAKLGRFFNGTRVDNDAQVIEVNLALRHAELAQAEFDLSRVETQRNNAQIKTMQNGKVFAVNIESGMFVRRGDSIGVIEGVPQQPYVVGKFKIDDVKLLNQIDHASVYIHETNQIINAKIVSVGHTRISRDYPLAALLDSVDGEVPVDGYACGHKGKDHCGGHWNILIETGT